MNDKADILGVHVNRFNLAETMELMCKAIDEDKKLRIAVTPVNCILWARKNKKLMDLYNSADIVTADGVPLLWASRLLKQPIRGRVTGLDLLPAFAAVAAEKRYSLFLLGAGSGVADKLAGVLQDANPGLTIAGTYSPPFAETFSDEENEKMVEKINRSEADVLWVSLTAPKQDFWIASHAHRLHANVAIGVGAAFDVVAGNIKRSPEWMQKAGLEWFYRLLKEPRRLSRRYLVEAPQFIPLLLLQFLKNSFKKSDQKNR